MREVIAALLMTLVAGAARAQMGPGPAAPGTAIACYNPTTGELIVSVNSVGFWYVESASGALTGEPDSIDWAGQTLGVNTDSRFGMIAFVAGSIDLIDWNPGAVAAPGLPVSDLRIWFGDNYGSPENSNDVALCVPEPATAVLVGTTVIAASPLRRRPRRQRPAN